MPLFARGYHIWCGAVVLVVGIPTVWYASVVATKLMPGGALETAPYLAALREHEATLSGSKTLLTSIESISREDQLRLAALVPPDTAIPSLVANLSHLTRAQNVILKAIDATPDATPTIEVTGRVGTLSVTLSLKGLDYPGLKRYLSAVTSNARLLDFVSVSFSPKTPELTLQLRTYYLKK